MQIITFARRPNLTTQREKRFALGVSNCIRTINEIIHYPSKFLIDYFDDIKAKVDIAYQTNLIELKGKRKSKEEVVKTWLKIVQIVEKCQESCFNNKLDEQIKMNFLDKLRNIESRTMSSTDDEIEDLENELLFMKGNLESKLLSNDKCLAVIAPKFDHKTDRISEQILVINEGFNPIEIQLLIKDPSVSFGTFLDYHDGNTPNLNHLKIKYVSDYLRKCENDIVYMNESLNELKSMRTLFNGCLGSDNLYQIQLRLDYLSCFNNLKELVIGVTCIQSFAVFKDLINLEILNIQNAHINNLESSELIALNKLKQFGLSHSIIHKMNLNTQLEIESLYFVDCSLKNVEKSRELLSDNIFSQFSFSIFHGLNKLIIRDMPSKICANMFVGLENLEYLEISENLSHSFELGCFNGLKNLKNLTFSDETLPYFVVLKKDIFVGLDKLEILDISSSCSDFNDGCFNGLTNLNELRIDLSYSSFKSLNSKDTFSVLSNLKVLRLKRVSTRFLEYGFLNAFTNLQRLYIKSKRIFLRKNALVSLEGLLELDLSGIKMFKFENECFNGLKNLSSLKMPRRRNYELINKNTFKDLAKLEKLDLKCSKLNLNSDTFVYLKNLKSLDLSYCWNVGKLTKDIFVSLQNLKTLNLCYNWRLQLEAGCFSGLTKLVYLNLSSSKLEELENDQFLGLLNLETLNLSNNQNLVLKSKCFGGLKNLKLLNLRDCNKLNRI